MIVSQSLSKRLNFNKRLKQSILFEGYSYNIFYICSTSSKNVTSTNTTEPSLYMGPWLGKGALQHWHKLQLLTHPHSGIRICNQFADTNTANQQLNSEQRRPGSDWDCLDHKRRKVLFPSHRPNYNELIKGILCELLSKRIFQTRYIQSRRKSELHVYRYKHFINPEKFCALIFCPLAESVIQSALCPSVRVFS